MLCPLNGVDARDLDKKKTRELSRLEKALRKNQNDPEILSKISNLYLEAEDYERAFQVLMDLIHIDPDRMRTRYNLGMIYSFLYEV